MHKDPIPGQLVIRKGILYVQGLSLRYVASASPWIIFLNDWRVLAELSNTYTQDDPNVQYHSGEAISEAICNTMIMNWPKRSPFERIFGNQT